MSGHKIIKIKSGDGAIVDKSGNAKLYKDCFGIGGNILDYFRSRL